MTVPGLMGDSDGRGCLDLYCIYSERFRLINQHLVWNPIAAASDRPLSPCPEANQSYLAPLFVTNRPLYSKSENLLDIC